MTTMAFVLGVAALFSLILAWEASSQDRFAALRPATLWSWLTGGNWPAKVGAGLLIIGSGALLRYVMLNGRLYQADSMDQILPDRVVRVPFFFQREGGDTVHPSNLEWLERQREAYGWVH